MKTETQRKTRILNSSGKDNALYIISGLLIALTMISALMPQTATGHIATIAAAALIVIATQKGDNTTRVSAIIGTYIAVITVSVLNSENTVETALLFLLLFFITGYSAVGSKNILTVSLVAMLILTLNFTAALMWTVLATFTLALNSYLPKTTDADIEEDENMKTFCFIIALIVIAAFLQTPAEGTIILPGKDYFYTEPGQLV